MIMIVGIKFHVKQFWILGPNFPKKRISGRKQKKRISPLNSAYPNESTYQISP